MARGIRKKLIYRDVASGKLIPKKVAEQSDPSTWLEEELMVVVDQFNDDQQESLSEEDVPVLNQPVQ